MLIPEQRTGRGKEEPRNTSLKMYVGKAFTLRKTAFPSTFKGTGENIHEWTHGEKNT